MTPEEIEQKYKTKLPYPTSPIKPERLKYPLKEVGLFTSSKIKEFDDFVEKTYKETSYEYETWKKYKADLTKYLLEKKAYEEALKNINLGLSAESTHAELLQMRAQHTDYVSSLKKTKSSAVNAHKKSRNKAKKTPSTAKNPLKNFWDKLRGR